MHACTRGRVLIRLRAVQRIDSSTHELEDAKRAHSVKVRACTLRISMYVNMLGLESQPKRMQIHRLWRCVFGCKTLFDLVQARGCEQLLEVAQELARERGGKYMDERSER